MGLDDQPLTLAGKDLVGTLQHPVHRAPWHCRSKRNSDVELLGLCTGCSHFLGTTTIVSSEYLGKHCELDLPRQLTGVRDHQPDQDTWIQRHHLAA